jgi:hypothetical protein
MYLFRTIGAVLVCAVFSRGVGATQPVVRNGDLPARTPKIAKEWNIKAVSVPTGSRPWAAMLEWFAKEAGLKMAAHAHVPAEHVRIIIPFKPGTKEPKNTR